MTIPTRAFSAITKIAFPFYAVSDPSDTNPYFYVTDPNGTAIGLGINVYDALTASGTMIATGGAPASGNLVASLAGTVSSVAPGTYNDATTGNATVAGVAITAFGQPTLTGSVATTTTTNAYTVYVAGAPIASTNETLTNSWALGVNGAARFLAPVSIAPTTSVTSGASATLNAINVPSTTITVGGSTGITTATGFNFINVVLPAISSAANITTAATMAITGAPSISGGGAITNSLALWVQAGSNLLTSTSANALTVNANSLFTNPVFNVDASTASVATGITIKGAAAGAGVNIAVTSSGSSEGLTIQMKSGSTNAVTLADTVAAATTPLMALVATDTPVGGVTDAFTGAIRVTPTINGSQTITRYNYIDVVQPAGNSTVTDAAVFRFNAAAGTHKAVDGATTKTTPGTVNGWLKVNVNGTIYYAPLYTSKTT